MRVGFACGDWAVKAPDPVTGHPTYGGSGWARMGLPAKYLRAGGHDVTEGTLVAHGSKLGVRDWDQEHHWDFDVLVCQRWMMEDIPERMRRARAAGQVIVNDLDDWFWGLDPRNQAFLATHPARNAYENRDHYKAVLAASDLVTVSTPYLADRLRKMFGNRVRVEVLENHVEVHRFASARTLVGLDVIVEEGQVGHRDQARVLTRDPGKPTFGWIGATPWRSGDVETMRGLLGPFLDRYDLRAYHGGHYPGSPSFARQAGLKDGQVDVRGMVPIDDYPSLFVGLDVGLVPLSSRPFNVAKSWIKGLEYAAAGVPFVAANLPEYERLEKTYGVGRTAWKAREWFRHWEALLDPEVRAEDRKRNLKGVQALDWTTGWTKWEGLYQELLNRG